MKLNKHDKHDDFCPCTRFRAQDDFCQCGAVALEEILTETALAFGERLREINQNPSPATNLVGICCGNPVHEGSPEAYTLECCGKFLASEDAIRKAGQVAIDALIDRGGFDHASDDELADYMTRIIDACIRAALSSAPEVSDNG